jgi:hypothetical protein
MSGADGSDFRDSLVEEAKSWDAIRARILEEAEHRGVSVGEVLALLVELWIQADNERVGLFLDHIEQRSNDGYFGVLENWNHTAQRRGLTLEL